MMSLTDLSGRYSSLAAAVVFLAALVAGCASPQKPSDRQLVTQKSYKVRGKWYHPVDQAIGFTQRGKASWYGKEFHGCKTANGECYNMYSVSAAHKTLPLGTWVRVNNLDNGRTLDVRLNDRGPFVHGRIIDLSYAAAKKLGVVGPGTANVKIIALGNRVASNQTTASKPIKYRAVDWKHGRFTFQVGAFSDPANADRYQKKLKRRYKNAHIVPYFHPEHGKLYGVRIGLAHSYKQALEYKTTLRLKGFSGAFTIAE